MTSNDLLFVRETVGLLEAAGIAAWVFGGWAEELLGLAAPRPHTCSTPQIASPWSTLS